MRNTLLLIFITVFQAYANDTYSQNAKLTLNLNNVTVANVLEEIENKSEFYFLFNSKLIDVEREVSISMEDKKISDILLSLFSGKEVNYLVYDRQIILTPGDVTALSATMQQQKQITGTVTDKNGAPVPGANVIVTGTTLGAMTDIDGKYSIEVPQGSKSLTFSFIGMEPQEIIIGTLANINITMAESVIGLEEVVVIGYGTQKKVDLTGSISTLSSKEIAKTSMPTLTQALMGKASGVYIKNESGQPGQTKTSFNIRGFGSPLIIVDGSPVSSSDFQNLDPNDIENFSVLKDAAAASIYGARAGNGVILVTTRRGDVSRLKFSYKSDFGLQFFTHVPEFVTSDQYLETWNYTLWAENKLQPYSREMIDAFKEHRDGSDPVNYPNNNMWDLTLRDIAPQSQHNFNISGGSEKVKYFVSAGWFNQDGMLRSDDIKYDRYSLRSNIDVGLTEKLNLGFYLSFNNQDYIGPRSDLSGDASGETLKEQGIMCRLYRMRPHVSIEPLPDPTIPRAYDGGVTVNPLQLAEIDIIGYKKWRKQFGDARFDLTYELPFGFKARANIFLSANTYRFKQKTLEAKAYDYDEETDTYIFRRQPYPYSMLEESNSITNNFNQQYFLTWDRTFKGHNFSSLFVYETLTDNYDLLEASRIKYAFDLDYLFAGPDLDKNNYGSGREGGRKAYIGRINYNYMEKYLLEINARRDASPNFPPDTRWGFFPSVALGWRISEEAFMKDISFLSNLKVRASYGKLGYDAAGAFQYLETYSLSGKYIYESVLQPALKAEAIPNLYITWEKMTTSNFGFDFGLWKGKVDGSFDYFYRKRIDVLGTRIRQIPDIVGAVLPQENYREFDNRGWELSLNHRYSIGQVNYSAGGNISWNREKSLVVDQSEFNTMEAYRTGNQVGEWTDRYWIYPTDGLFQSQEEIDNWAIIDGNSNAKIQPGDIKFIDYNEDGRITREDMVLGGRGEIPRFTYGLTASASWKGIDFSMLWQGSGLFNLNLNRSTFVNMVFSGMTTPRSYLYDESYIPEGNPWIEPNTTNAKYPRYRGDSFNKTHPNYQLNSDFWYVNASYIRLKNIQLGYTLPKNITNRIRIDNLRVYVGGYNVLTFSGLKEFIDPEAEQSPAYGVGAYYPILGTYNFGIELNF